MKTSPVIALFVASVQWLAAGPSSPNWLRQPAVSSDGRQIAFIYGGQLWHTPSEGGEAVSLTSALFRAGSPVWSPDSKLRPGAVILAVNGKTIDAESDIHSLLNHAAGQALRLNIQSADGGAAVEEIVTPETYINSLVHANDRWVNQSRARRKTLWRPPRIRAHRHDAHPGLSGFLQRSLRQIYRQGGRGRGCPVQWRRQLVGPPDRRPLRQVLRKISGSRWQPDRRRARRARDKAEHPASQRVQLLRWQHFPPPLQGIQTWQLRRRTRARHRHRHLGLVGGPSARQAFHLRHPRDRAQNAGRALLRKHRGPPDILIRRNPDAIGEGSDEPLEAAVSTLLKQLDAK